GGGWGGGGVAERRSPCWLCRRGNEVQGGAMSGTNVRLFLRRHVLGLLAIFIALSGSAIAADAGPTASKSVVTDAKFKKLKSRVSALEGRTTSLEGKPAPVIPTSLPPKGPAGGALSGSYPNPALGTIVTHSNSIALAAGASDDVTANCGAGEQIISGGAIPAFILPIDTIQITRSHKTGTEASPGNGWV